MIITLFFGFVNTFLKFGAKRGDGSRLLKIYPDNHASARGWILRLRRLRYSSAWRAISARYLIIIPSDPKIFLKRRTEKYETEIETPAVRIIFLKETPIDTPKQQ